MVSGGDKWLLIDSTADPAWLALADSADVLVERRSAGREFSARWAGLLREALAECGSRAAELTRIAVVNGPGSFTGVRVGLAATKGLAEATGARVVVLSKLQLIVSAAENAGLMTAEGAGTVAARVMPVLDAGRGRVFTYGADGRECTRELDDVQQQGSGELVTSDTLLAERLHCLHVCVDAALLLRNAAQLAEAGRFADVALLDANYVASEDEIYGHGKRTASRDIAAAAKVS